MRKFTKEHKRKISGALKKGGFFYCLQCGNSFWRKPYAIKKGNNKFCSKECYFKWQRGKPKIVMNPADKCGSNNPNWRGGIRGENQEIRASDEFKAWRIEIFERDDYTCQECGARNGNGSKIILHAHHVKPFAKFPELRFDLNNGQTLCKDCHHEKPKGKDVWLII